jgi:arginase
LSSEDKLYPTSPQARFKRVVNAASDAALAVEQVVSAGDRLLVLGGDHSIAAGTWAGAARAIRNRGDLGLIWIDAHMDAHVPGTTPSGNWHGMPLAHLLGYGRSELAELAGNIPAVRPENLCLVGVRSYESDEAALLDKLGVRVIDIGEIRRIGLAGALDEAVRVATSGTAGFGVSWDIDSVDPVDAPGVGTPVAGGIDGDDLLRTLPSLASYPACLGLEVVEYNPFLDPDGRSYALLADVVSRWCSRIACPKLASAA